MNRFVSRLIDCNSEFLFEQKHLVRIETKRFTIFGLRNVHETNNDAFLRSIETTERHLLDCIVELRDLRCNVDCTIKIGKSWWKRLTIREQTFTIDLDRCLIYLELLFHHSKRKCTLEKWSPISQEHIRCKLNRSKQSNRSINRMITVMLQKYFEKHFVQMILKHEKSLQDYVNQSNLLDYEQLQIEKIIAKKFSSNSDKNLDLERLELRNKFIVNSF